VGLWQSAFGPEYNKHNHIRHLGRDVLADMRGTYTLGEASGSVPGNNVIHDIGGDGEKQHTYLLRVN
jgi:hypothetical protein